MANIKNPRAISEKAEEIYNEKYRADFEHSHQGQFVAINIIDGTATLGDSAMNALLGARAAYPDGIFHLIRVGHTGAFEVGLAYKDVPSSRIHR